MRCAYFLFEALPGGKTELKHLANMSSGTSELSVGPAPIAHVHMLDPSWSNLVLTQLNLEMTQW